jgi:hypothetical protein
MRACRVNDAVLYDFADGVTVDIARISVPETDIDAHVAGCDECQGFLAELWAGELETDLVEPVLRVVELERFLLDVARLGTGIVAELIEALRRYGLGARRDEGA